MFVPTLSQGLEFNESYSFCLVVWVPHLCRRIPTRLLTDPSVSPTLVKTTRRPSPTGPLQGFSSTVSMTYDFLPIFK